jgi:hypothetical protein
METNNLEKDVPKPLTCEVAGNEVRATFGREELQRYLDNTEEIVIWVQDAEGQRIPMRVEFLREILV